jgi:hypothetical protein
MSKVRTAARVDGNHGKIIAAVRAIGATVLDTHQLPNCFDALIGYRGREFIFEIKDPAQPASGRKLTPGELLFKNNWRGSEYHVVETTEQAIKIITQNSKTPKNFPPFYEPKQPVPGRLGSIAPELCIYGAASPHPEPELGLPG